MGLILLSTIAVALVMLIMAVGVIFSNRCLRGSCGGGAVLGFDGEPLACDACPLRDTPQDAPHAAEDRGCQESTDE